jgi:hypothetical protein
VGAEEFVTYNEERDEKNVALVSGLMVVILRIAVVKFELIESTFAAIDEPVEEEADVDGVF